MKLRFVPSSGDRGARARLARFQAVERLAAIAHERQVDAVVVAGDVFDDNAVGPETLQQAADELAKFTPIPVLLLPGNHDAATPDAALARLRAGEHVRVLLDEAPIDVGGARFWPCPLRHRHERDDPTRHLPPRQDGDPVRVAVAHGGLLDFGEGESANRIDWTRVIAKGFDYLALGDWHGALRFGDRVAYSGAPEPTTFKCNDTGLALIVEIDAPGATPRVERVPVARTRWLQGTRTLLGDVDVDALERWLAELPERSWTLVDLTLEGALSLTARARLDAILDREAQALMLLRWDATALRDEPTDEDLRSLAAEGWLGRAVDGLVADGAPEARDALRLLHRLLAEVSS